MTIPFWRSTIGRYQSTVLSNPASSSVTGCSACERLRTLSRVDCAISETSTRSARKVEPSGAWRPARRSMEPIAVSICPNSSCNSREICNSVDSWVAISFCASSLRCSDKIGQPLKQQPIRANEIQAGQHDGHQRGQQKQQYLPLHPVVDLLDALSGLLFGFIVGDQLPRHRDAQRRLVCLQRDPNLVPRLVLVARRSQAANMWSAAPQNCFIESSI